jgi:hypothetical protein
MSILGKGQCKSRIRQKAIQNQTVKDGRRQTGRLRQLGLLADIHIAENRDEIARQMKMAANFERVGGELLALSERLARVLIDGDCAYLQGKPGDYLTLVELLSPLRTAGLPVHLALGNHDHRERFWTAAVTKKDESAPSGQQACAGD